MIQTEEKKTQQALLVGSYRRPSQRALCEEHLKELEQLAYTCDIDVVETFPCSLRKIENSTYITKGKLAELVVHAAELGVDIIIFDDEIHPTQQRNLEQAFNKKVIDRTEVILDVFAIRAHTKEAQLQVELARVQYQLPRLKRLWDHLHRQRGGGVYLKGEGEKQIEIDRRILNKRIAKLSKDIEEVRLHRDTQRIARQRSDTPTFAIVGYTNAGKSTLLNALTDAEVLVEDKLFATLDTTTREFLLPNNMKVLLIDTVGFIRKLPHTLIAAFRSTLEEAVYADMLLHIVDVSHPLVEEHIAATYEVLHELGAQDKNIITVLNKTDICTDPSLEKRMRVKYPNIVPLSAILCQGFENLTAMMVKQLSERRQILSLRIPQSNYDAVTELMREGKILQQEYEDNDILVRAEIPPAIAQKFEPFLDE